MNFTQTDYLQDLNLDFGSPNESKADLDMFSQVDFFDLDVLSNDNVVPMKPSHEQEQYQQQVLHQYIQQQPVYVKQEDTSYQLPAQQLTPPSLSSTPSSRSPYSDSGPVVTEDKRKRNTEASARFRIKKKQKEQDMERRSKDLRERVGSLEKKLKTLEMENKCLKQLILQQNEQKNTDLLENIKKRSILESRSVFAYTK